MKVQDAIFETTWSMAVRNDVYLLFKEGLNNAVKYSGASNIHVQFDVGQKAAHLMIEDDGKGFDTTLIDPKLTAEQDSTENSGGNGIINMRSRASELGGKLHIQSSAKSGTQITLEIPL